MKRSGKIPRTLAAAFLLLAAAVSVRAQSSLQAEIKAFFIGTQNASDSIQSYLGHRTQVDENLSLRVKWTWSKGPFDFTAHYLVAGRNGDTVALEPQLEHLFEAGGPAPAMPWWNLSRTIHAARQTEVTQRFDRFYAGYTGAHLVVRVGRQALTWGTGLVFHPMDLFNPFSPNAVDTEYKPGTDMLYGQWLFNSGSDLQGLVVPRRNSLTGRLEGGQASTAVKWHGAGARFQTDVMAAKHYGDKILGADVSGPAGGAAWSAGVVATRLQGGGTRVSWVANLRSAQTWAGKSTTLYVKTFTMGSARPAARIRSRLFPSLFGSGSFAGSCSTRDGTTWLLGRTSSGRRS
ncbi:MAG: hypothetical protein P8Z49_10925 [Acidobacteriota bacterium]